MSTWVDANLPLAERLNVTMCGYVRPDGLNLYTGDAVLLEKAMARA